MGSPSLCRLSRPGCAALPRQAPAGSSPAAGAAAASEAWVTLSWGQSRETLPLGWPLPCSPPGVPWPLEGPRSCCLPGPAHPQPMVGHRLRRSCPCSQRPFPGQPVFSGACCARAVAAAAPRPRPAAVVSCVVYFPQSAAAEGGRPGPCPLLHHRRRGAVRPPGLMLPERRLGVSLAPPSHRRCPFWFSKFPCLSAQISLRVTLSLWGSNVRGGLQARPGEGCSAGPTGGGQSGGVTRSCSHMPPCRRWD